MRRLYESGAVERDEENAFTPNPRDRETEPQAMRHVPGTTLSRLLVPNSLRYRAISVSIDTSRDTYREGEPVPFAVRMKNALPIPVELPTLSPVLWRWRVDGAPEASRIPLREPPNEKRGFRFDRGERKQFRKRWNQKFRISGAEWEPAGRGEHTISAALNVDEPEEKGLYDETTIRIK